MKWVLLSIFLNVSVAQATDFNRLSVQVYCSEVLGCSNEISQKFDFAKLACAADVQSLGCEELAKKNPELEPLMRKCDTDSMCKQEMDYMKIEEGNFTTNKDRACLRGYKNSLVDMGIAIKDMSLSLKDLVADSWEKAKTNRTERAAFLKECNKSLLCKRDLVKEDHRYNQLSDDKLANYTADFLYIESRDLKAYKASMDRARPPAYVPLSERPQDDLDMPIESRQKLSHLAAMAKEKLKEQYTKYACYHPLAQEEMECYAIGMVVDPTLVAGYFVKAGRAFVAARSLGKVDELAAASRAGEAGVQAARAGENSRQLFIQKNLSYSPTTRAENLQWMELAKKGPSSNTVFVDVENSVMKKLNDSLKDKNLVTSLTNAHKEKFFEKVKDLEKDYPGLKVERYSDFKSSRVAFSGEIPKDLQARLEKIFKETNDELVNELRQSNIIRQEDAAEDWFRGGVGNSADEANLAARYSRTQKDNSLQAYSKAELQTRMTESVQSVEEARKALRIELRGTSMISGSTMHEDAFDIVRKNYGKPAQIKRELKQRFALQELSDDTVKKMEAYSKKVDEFSPGIWVEARDFASLEDAVHGGLSADMIGLGAQNLKGTAEALARSSNLNKALTETRLAEQGVTQAFKDQKATFESVVKSSLPPDKVKTVCSGDDCVVIATKALTTSEKNQIVKNLANTKYAGKFRLAFVNEGIKDGHTRTMLTTHGESLEKTLRKSLSGSIDPNKLRGLTFATDMKSKELGQGPVDLLVGSVYDVKLTKNEQKLIRDHFQQAIKDLNFDLVKQGEKGNYTSLPAGGW